MKKILYGFLALIVAFILLVAMLWHFNVIWTLAPYYKIESKAEFEVPIMDMEAYKEIWDTHRRPYIYTIQNKSGGAVLVCGVTHTKDVEHPHLDSVKLHWTNFNPDIVLVEGRVGNLISWFQDPILELGEGGLVTSLAHKKGIELYTWEPIREFEINTLLQKYPAEELVMFYTFRPYIGNMRYGKYDDPEARLQDYLDSRADYPQLKGIFRSWQELDKKWKQDFPDVGWRDYPPGTGYPEGYLNNIWNDSNLARDEYMLNIILELMAKGKKVFVVMGTSHAPRIEGTLKAAIQSTDH